MVLYAPINRRRTAVRLFSQAFETAIQEGMKLLVGESFIEALIQGFKHDIKINSESKTLARKLPKVFTAPSFQSIPQNSGTDFATDGDSKTKGPRLIQLIIEK